MIIKFFELQKINLKKNNFFLLHGKNNGLKYEIIKNLSQNYKEITKYEEKEIIENGENILTNLFSRSFFEDKKEILIKRASDKILKFIEKVTSKNIDDITIFIDSDGLEKKSKLRSLFEKEKQLICIPLYPDNEQTMSRLIYNFLREKKITLSNENVNFLIKRSNGDREILINELRKIENYCKDGKKLNTEILLKLINLIENHNFTELADQCLLGNNKRLVQILNENNFSNEDCVVISRILLNKSKKLFDLTKSYKINNNIETTISTAKPPIFWKDKEIIKKQILRWSKLNLREFMFNINSLELNIKKNLGNPINYTMDFILEYSKQKSNS